MTAASLWNRAIARRPVSLLLAALLGFIAVERASTQTPNPADGPWAFKLLELLKQQQP